MPVKSANTQYRKLQNVNSLNWDLLLSFRTCLQVTVNNWLTGQTKLCWLKWSGHNPFSLFCFKLVACCGWKQGIWQEPNYRFMGFKIQNNKAKEAKTFSRVAGLVDASHLNLKNDGIKSILVSHLGMVWMIKMSCPRTDSFTSTLVSKSINKNRHNLCEFKTKAKTSDITLSTAH